MNIRNLFEEKKCVFSFEMFPPKKNSDDINAMYETIDGLKRLGPDYISITYGAGGSGGRGTERLAAVDMAMAVALDAAGTAAVESAADEAEVLLRSELKGAELTPRFSPGYGDMPLSFGRDIIKLTEAERYLGVTLTESDTLLPSKSVTAVIGIKGGNSEKTGESL